MKCNLVKNLGATIIDITNILNQVEYSSSVEQGVVTLNLSVVNDKTTNIEVGDVIQYEDTNFNFHGQVQIDENSNKQEILKYEVVDFMSHWTRSKTTKVVNSTPEDVAKELCAYLGMAQGPIATTGIATGERAYQGKSFYDIVVDLYKRAGAENGKEYVIRAEGASFTVKEKGEVINYIISDTLNLTKVTHKRDMSNMVNRVVVYDDSNNKIDEKSLDIVNQVGVYQEVANKDANLDEILKDIEDTLEVEGIGDNLCQSGKYIRFKDNETNKHGIYEITEDQHTITTDGHTMKLRLKFIRTE